MAISIALPWHAGEEEMHKLLRVPDHDNPTVSMLSPKASNLLQRGPMIAIGTLDGDGRPWTTLWGGEAGLSQPLGDSIIGIKTPVDRKHDPVIETLFSGKLDGGIVKEEGSGRMISGLTVDLDRRDRVKLYGRMVAGAVQPIENEEPDRNASDSEGRVQLVMKIEQSLGNCPKYLNRKTLRPATVNSKILSSSSELTDKAVQLINKSDLFFISSTHGDLDMDTNHRGGPTGFVRTRKTDTGDWEIIWPEYSGNRFYQTLGNLRVIPLAGLVFPDFDNGNILYVTGRTEILIGSDAEKLIPRSNLAVKLTIHEARLVAEGLPFRGTAGDPSPYNPKVRPLASEAILQVDGNNNESANKAKLLEQVKVTPSISRFRFSLDEPADWKPGQWVALDCSRDLDIGYSHMRDDDPTSLNDDFIRTFTVSSAAPSENRKNEKEFEITIRKVGPVTKHLFSQGGESGLELPIKGFGGEVQIEQDNDGSITPVVVGGVGVTPLLAQLHSLNFDNLKIFWTLHVDDIHLALDMVQNYPNVANSLALYITSIKGDVPDSTQKVIDQLMNAGTSLYCRRIQKEDFNIPNLSNRWHVCVSTKLRESLVQWLPGKELVYEDFNF